MTHTGAMADGNNQIESHGSMKYTPSLDGLRAVAILAVLGFHTTQEFLPGGFTGVDVFFVLSGYLITSVILHDIRRGSFSMQEFYLRRIQRLLPNAVLMVLITVTLSLAFLLPLNTVKVAEHGVWALFNLSNVYIFRNIGEYWADSASSTPLLHTWSLAVEEQFYLVFPLTLWLLYRRTSVLAVIAGLSMASLALSVYGSFMHPEATFYLLPTRAWEPLLGASLAAYMIPATADRPLRRLKPSPSIEIAGWAGLAIIAASSLLLNENIRFPPMNTLLPSIGALALLVSIADGKSGPAQLLSHPFLVWVGRLSYSLYLWHWPLSVIGGQYASLTGRSVLAGKWIGLSAGVGMAVLAYWLVESPLRKRGPGRHRRLWALGSGFSACALLCLVVSSWHPIADSLGYFDRPASYSLLYDVGEKQHAPVAAATKFEDVLIPAGTSTPEVWKSGGIIHNWGKEKPRVVVLGSSHAMMYGRVIDDICKQQGLSVAFLSASSTSVFFHTRSRRGFPTLALAHGFDAARRRWIREWKPDIVFAIDRWDRRARDPAVFNRDLRELAGELTPYTQTLILFSQVPVLRLGEAVNLREYVSWYVKTFGRLPRIGPDGSEQVRKSSIDVMEVLAHDFPQVQLLRMDRLFYAEDGSVRYSSGRSFFYADDNHLTEAGAEQVREICTRAIRAGLTGHP